MFTFPLGLEAKTFSHVVMTDTLVTGPGSRRREPEIHPRQPQVRHGAAAGSVLGLIHGEGQPGEQQRPGGRQSGAQTGIERSWLYAGTDWLASARDGVKRLGTDNQYIQTLNLQANFQEPDTASSVIAPVTHQLLSRSFSQRRSFADAREEDLVETAPRARTSFDSREIADKPLRRRIPSSVKPEATDDNTKGRSDVNTAAGEDVQRIRGGRRKSSTHAPEASADNVGRSPPRRSRTTTISPAQEQPTSGFDGARRRSSPKDTVLTSPSDATPRRRGPANEGNDAVPQEIGSRVTSSSGGSHEISKNSRRKPSRTSAPTTSDDASPLRSRGGARRQPSTQETVGRSSRTGSGRQTATTITTTTSTTTTSSPPVAVTVKDVEELQVTASSEPEGTAGTRDHIPVVETVDDLPANTGPASIVDAFSTTSKVNGPNYGKPRESVGGSVDVSKISRNAAGSRNASPSSNDRRKKTFSRSTTAEQASESQSVESSTAAIFSRRKSLRNQAADRDENIPTSRKQTLRNWRTTHSPLDQDELISASAVPEAANLISFPVEVVSTTRGPEVVPNELNAIPELVQPVNAEQGFRRLRVSLRKDQTDASGDAGSQEIVRTRPSSRSNAASGKRDSENTPVRSETVPKFNKRPSRPATSDDANLAPTSSNRDRTTESSVADVMSGRRIVATEPLRRGVNPQISKGRPKDPFKFEPRRPGRLSSSANAYRTSHEQVEVRPEAGVTLEETQPMEVQETRDILKNVRYTEQIEPSRSPQSDLEESFITRSSQQVVTITVLPETTSAIQVHPRHHPDFGKEDTFWKALFCTRKSPEVVVGRTGNLAVGALWLVGPHRSGGSTGAPVNSLFSSRSPDFPTRFANLRNKYRASLDAEAKASSGTRTRKYQKPGSDVAPATESSRQIPATLAGRPEHGPRHRFSPGAAERPLFSAGYRKSSSPPSPLEEDVSRPSSTPSRSTSGIRRSVPVTPPSDLSTTSSSVGVPRFSARYKSDLLRAATGLRATTTPVYLPTVPTVRPNTSTTTEGTSIVSSTLGRGVISRRQTGDAFPLGKPVVMSPSAQPMREDLT
uniref:Uncharacterized protein n=1 Tax=Timema bartmani TaxID=61472 RepID=A0A7R9FB09_9NEOP|nr:unnamed protein product [Timema bartmani]